MVVEKYLGEDLANDMLCSSLISCLINTKQAEAISVEMEKDAQRGGEQTFAGRVLGALGTFLGNLPGHAINAAEKVPSGLGWLAAGGATTGILGAAAYDAIKERMSEEDPDAKFNAEVEAIYAGKKKELEHARWMARVRKMRDELSRGYKKMPPDEYSAKYRKLIAALDEMKDDNDVSV